MKGNSTAAGLFTSSNLTGDSGVYIYQLNFGTLLPTLPEEGNNGGEFNYNAVTYGIIIAVVSLSIIVGFTVYQIRKQRSFCIEPQN